jgi:hypothetical protein
LLALVDQPNGHTARDVGHLAEAILERFEVEIEVLADAGKNLGVREEPDECASQLARLQFAICSTSLVRLPRS